MCFAHVPPFNGARVLVIIRDILVVVLKFNKPGVIYFVNGLITIVRRIGIAQFFPNICLLLGSNREIDMCILSIQLSHHPVIMLSRHNFITKLTMILFFVIHDEFVVRFAPTNAHVPVFVNPVSLFLFVFLVAVVQDCIQFQV